MKSTATEIPSTARLLRVDDARQFYCRMAGVSKEGTTILAEGLQSLYDQDLFVVSYESEGDWRVFVGQVAIDNGVVETPDGLHLRSLVMKSSDSACVRL